jgi:hypothetical protein|tara:strand:+ start:436 stop:660 length:225 start_codon:yes stop_codon:yes gene_type:complete
MQVVVEQDHTLMQQVELVDLVVVELVVQILQDLLLRVELQELIILAVEVEVELQLQDLTQEIIVVELVDQELLY